jgi:hypothetical protein
VGSNVIDAYFEAKDALHKAFGYVEDWHIYDVRDYREDWWGTTPDVVIFAAKPEIVDHVLADEEPVEEDYYSHVIRTDGFMGRSEWHWGANTMLLCDTETDGNVVLAVFDDEKRR